MLTSENFKNHIASKDSPQSKGERAQFLYGSYNYDCSLPENWIRESMVKTGNTYNDFTSNFVWLYIGNDDMPAPLNPEGCDILAKLESL